MRSATVILLGAGVVAAHKGCGGHEIMRRNPGGPTVTRESAWAKKRDANPCDGYDYPQTYNSRSQYPTSWQIASIVSNDTAARTLFSGIDSKVRSALPNTVPKGTPDNSMQGVTYNGGSDPDCWWTYTQCTTPTGSTGLQADISTVPEPGSYGLTYDDGPNCGNAPLYGWMKDNGVRSTLFYIGSNVQSWPLQAIAGYTGGHEICVHTWSHHYMTSLTNEQVFAELYYTQRMIKDVIGITPQCWRPPFGDTDNRVRMIAAELGMRTVLWSEDSADWTLNNGGNAPATVDGNYQGFINKQKSGQYSTYGPVVLSHELSDKTINEALKFLPSLKSAFTHLVPIFTAYNQTHPYAETNVTYPTFAEYASGKLGPTGSNSTSTSASSAPSSSSSSASTSSAVATSSASAAPTTASTSSSASSGPSASANGNTSNANVQSGSVASVPLTHSAWSALVVAGIAWTLLAV